MKNSSNFYSSFITAEPKTYQNAEGNTDLTNMITNILKFIHYNICLKR